MDIEVIKKASSLYAEAHALLARGPLSFYLDTLDGSYIYMMERFCPFQAGDRVALTETPDIEPSSGWYHCRHYLVKGSPGTVKNAECDAKGFRFDVSFDNESWIDREGNLNPIPHQHTFVFYESSLRHHIDRDKTVEGKEQQKAIA